MERLISWLPFLHVMVLVLVIVQHVVGRLRKRPFAGRRLDLRIRLKERTLTRILFAHFLFGQSTFRSPYVVPPGYEQNCKPTTAPSKPT